jgi:hypothetical protein
MGQKALALAVQAVGVRVQVIDFTTPALFGEAERLAADARVDGQWVPDR